VHAMAGHMDTMRAAAWSGSAQMLVLSMRQMDATVASANRRFARFGARDCVG